MRSTRESANFDNRCRQRPFASFASSREARSPPALKVHAKPRSTRRSVRAPATFLRVLRVFAPSREARSLPVLKTHAEAREDLSGHLQRPVKASRGAPVYGRPGRG